MSCVFTLLPFARELPMLHLVLLGIWKDRGGAFSHFYFTSIVITCIISGHEQRTVHRVETLLVLCLWTMLSNTDFIPKLIL